MRSTAFRRFSICLLLVLAWLGVTVQGSHALFSDSATLAGESIVAGTTDLQVSNSQNGSSTLYADSRPGFVHHLSPLTNDENYFFLKNVAPSEVPLSIDVYVTNVQPASADMIDHAQVTFTPVDSTGASTGTPVTFTLRDMTEGHRQLGITIQPGASQRIKLTLGLTSQYSTQGETIGYDFVFTGTQVVPK